MNDWHALHQALDEHRWRQARSKSAKMASGSPNSLPFQWEFRGQGANPLIHLWSDGRNLTRRVVRVKEQSSGKSHP